MKFKSALKKTVFFFLVFSSFFGFTKEPNDALSIMKAPLALKGQQAPQSISVGSGFGCGGTCDHLNIQLAYNSIPPSLTQDYVIEVYDNYTAGSENVPVNFGGKSMNGFTITIRPAAGQNDVLFSRSTSSTAPLFSFDDCQGLVFDGRPGGLGTELMRIRSTNTLDAAGAIFQFRNSSSSNVLRYLVLESETDPDISGMIDFLGGGNGNDDNLIEYCRFGDLSVGGSGRKPGVAIYSNGPVNGNDGITISNNEFEGVWKGDISESHVIQVLNNSNDWVISDNHFYQSDGVTYNNNDNNSSFLYLAGASNFLITRNYFGGSAVMAGGNAMTITGGLSAFDGVYITSGSTGSFTISNNVFSNIRYSANSPNLGSFPSLSLVYCDESVDLVVEGNTFGSLTTNLNIQLEDNGTDGVGMSIITYDQNDSDRSLTVNNNDFGGLSVSGTNPQGDHKLIDVRNEGDADITNNTFGGSLANNLRQSSGGDFTIIRSLSVGTLYTGNNSFQNISHQGTNGNLELINNSFGSITAFNNSINTVSSDAAGDVKIIDVVGAVYLIDSNTVENITVTNSSASHTTSIAYINSNADGTVLDNTFGEGVGSIKSSFNNDLIGVHKLGSGKLVLTNNSISGMSTTNSNGTLNELYGVFHSGGTLEARNNSIYNLSASSDITDVALAGIYLNSASTSNQIIDNEISECVISGTGSGNPNLVGIFSNQGGATLEANYIHALRSNVADPDIVVSGIQTEGNGTSTNVYNNVVLMQSNATTGAYQLRGMHLGTDSDNEIFHNTIGLRSSSNLEQVVGVFFESTSSAFIRNNVILNEASSSNSGEFVYYSGLNLTGVTLTHNYINATNNTVNPIVWNLVGSTLASWIGTRTAGTSFTGAETLTANGQADGLFFADRGTDLTATVPDDFDDILRDADPWVGAFEGNFQCTPLAGTYTIGGTTPDYTTLSDAVADLEECGVSSSVTFSIRTGTYVEQFEINEIAGVSASDTVVFVSETGNPSDVNIEFTATNSNDNFIVLLDSADYITFSAITFKPLSNAFARAVVFSNKATNNRFFKCLFEGATTGGTSTELALIFNDQNAIGVNQNCDSNEVIKNTFNNGTYGVYWRAFSLSGARAFDNLYEDNDFNQNTAGAINLRGPRNVRVNSNQITVSSTTSSYDAAIRVGSGTEGVEVINNQIELNGTQSVDGINVNNISDVFGGERLIANNLISITGGGSTKGILVFNNASADVLHNSIALYSTGVTSAAVEESSFGSGNAVIIENNILLNEGGYAIFIENAGNVANSDFNNLFSSAADIGHLGGVNQPSLTDWQTVTGFDNNSVAVDPNFISNTNLKLQEESPSLLRVNNDLSATLPTDIDGESRPSNPLMGADERNLVTIPDFPGSAYTVEFDGTSNYVRTPNFNVDLTTHSVEAWIKTAPNSMTGFITALYTVEPLALFGLTDGKLNVYLTQGTGSVRKRYESDLVVNDGRWHHVAYTFDFNNLSFHMYVDGIEQFRTLTDGALPLFLNAQQIFIGSAAGSSGFFDGEIDEIRVHSNVLSQSTIQDYMCKQLTSAHPDWNELEVYYGFNGSTGTTLRDQKNDYDGNLLGGLGDGDWKLSGAPVGDSSVFTYGGNSLTADFEDKITLINFSDSVKGIHIYFINDTVNNNSSASGISNYDEEGYYGVFKVGDSSATYDVVYDYSGNPLYDGVANEQNLRIVRRTNNATTDWDKSTGQLTLDTDNNTITLPGQTGTEYVLGFANTTYPDEPGPGFALQLSGSEYVEIPDDPSVNFNADVSIEFWLNLLDNTVQQHIIDKKDGLNNGYLIELTGAGQLRFAIEGPSGFADATTNLASFPTNQWVHVMCRYVPSNGVVVILLNGKRVALDNGSLGINSFSTPLPLFIGSDQDGTKGLRGAIDELRMWSNNIRPDTLRDFMCSKGVDKHPFFADLRSYYRFDDGAGTTLGDLNLGNDGNIVGGASFITSGAFLGDTSMHSYATGLVTMSIPNAGNLIIDQGAASDSLHLYYVYDTANTSSATAIIDSVVMPGYWGVVPMANTNSFELNLDYTPRLSLANDPNESLLTMVGRQDNTGTWGKPTLPSISTLNTSANLINVTQLSGKFETNPAFEVSLGPAYYVNDNANAGDVYTTSVGNDAMGCGTTSNPCETVSYLLSEYALVQGDTIFIDAGSYAESEITFSSDTAVVIGAGIDVTVFDGTALPNTSRCFVINSPDIVLSSMTIENYTNSATLGTAVFASQFKGQVTLSTLKIDGNSASPHGPGFYVNADPGDSIVSLIDTCIFTNNAASALGGALYFQSQIDGLAFSTVSRCSIGTSGNGNTSVSLGGAIMDLGDSLTIINTSFIDNRSTSGSGGALSSTNYAAISNCQFLNNSATTGGAIVVPDGDLIIANSSFGSSTQSNFADQGAGIYFDGDSLIVTQTVFRNNLANINGGGLYQDAGVVIIDSSSFVENNATASGGGIYASTDAATLLIINGAEIGRNSLGNTALDGGGVYFAGDTLIISSSDFTENDADAVSTNAGGGLYLNNTLASLYDVDFDNNSATNGHGGAILASNSLVFVDSSVFNDSYALELGGAILALGSTRLIIDESDFGTTLGNVAQEGGAIKFNADTLVITNTIFENNEATDAGDAGGAIHTGSNTLVQISSSLFDNNDASSNNGNGGAILLSNSYMEIDESAFIGNSAGNNGGALKLNSGSVVYLLDSTFIGDVGEGNVATNGNGGGIWMSGDSLIMQNGFVIDNDAEDGQAGGLYTTNGAYTYLEKVELNGNQNGNSSNGGAIYIDGTGTDVFVYQSEFNDNIAAGNGGAIANNGDTLYLENSLLYDNVASGFYTVIGQSNSKTILNHVTLAQNEGAGSGGIATAGGSATMEVTNSIVYFNSGAQITENGTIDISNSVIEGAATPSWTGINVSNVDGDPVFTDTANGDYSIQVESSALDIGAAVFGTSEDILADVRPIGPGFDAGAYENTCDSSNVAGTWTWTGTNSSNWFDCANWDQGSVPGINADVDIPGTTTATNQPLIRNRGAYCRTITIDTNDSAEVTIDVDNSGTLEINSP